jgi:hypothetical protein
VALLWQAASKINDSRNGNIFFMSVLLSAVYWTNCMAFLAWSS